MDGVGGLLHRGAEAGQPRAGIENEPGSIPGGELQGLLQNQIPFRLYDFDIFNEWHAVFDCIQQIVLDKFIQLPVAADPEVICHHTDHPGLSIPSSDYQFREDYLQHNVLCYCDGTLNQYIIVRALIPSAAACTFASSSGVASPAVPVTIISTVPCPRGWS